MEAKVLFFQFDIIINVLAGSFRFIWITMLWVYDHYKYFNFYSARNDSDVLSWDQTFANPMFKHI